MIYFGFWSRIGEHPPPPPAKWSFISTQNAPTLTFSFEFFISSYAQGFIWNGIVAKTFTLTNANTIFLFGASYWFKTINWVLF